MSDYPVPIVVISEAQRDRYFETGYKPLTNDSEKKNFSAEYAKVCDQLQAALEKYWKHDSHGDFSDSNGRMPAKAPLEQEKGDFFISCDYTYDRFVPVEVLKEGILTPKLLRIVHEEVLKIEPDYSVDICDAITVLKTKDGEFYPRFNIFIEKKQILIYSESDDLFEKLGIPYPPATEKN